MTNFRGYSEEKLIQMIEYYEYNIAKNKEAKMPIKQIMTRAEATKIFEMVDTGQAARWVDFFIAAGILEVKEEEEDKPIFEIKGIHGSPLHIKIWANGEVSGIQGTIINRIPEYLKNNS